MRRSLQKMMRMWIKETMKMIIHQEMVQMAQVEVDEAVRERRKSGTRTIEMFVLVINFV